MSSDYGCAVCGGCSRVEHLETELQRLRAGIERLKREFGGAKIRRDSDRSPRLFSEVIDETFAAPGTERLKPPPSAFSERLSRKLDEAYRKR